MKDLNVKELTQHHKAHNQEDLEDSGGLNPSHLLQGPHTKPSVTLLNFADWRKEPWLVTLHPLCPLEWLDIQ